MMISGNFSSLNNMVMDSKPSIINVEVVGDDYESDAPYHLVTLKVTLSGETKKTIDYGYIIYGDSVNGDYWALSFSSAVSGSTSNTITVSSGYTEFWVFSRLPTGGYNIQFTGYPTIVDLTEEN